VIPLADKVVDWDKILEVIYSSLGAALAVALAFSVAVAGSTRFAEERRDGAPARAAVWAVLAALGVAVCIAAIVLGIVVITTKD
jgi:predicted RND superfamily exporter protein